MTLEGNFGVSVKVSLGNLLSGKGGVSLTESGLPWMITVERLDRRLSHACMWSAGLLPKYTEQAA